LTIPAAAALAGQPTEAVTRWLDRLVRAHLVEEPSPGRYALHDLLRHYAAGKAVAEDGDRGEALSRLYDHIAPYRTPGKPAMFCPWVNQMKGELTAWTGAHWMRPSSGSRVTAVPHWLTRRGGAA
jgi:hypothetical protein